VPDALLATDARSVIAEEQWDRLLVSGTFAGEALATLDVSESRLVGVDGLGAEVRQLTLTDVVLESCNLSGALLRNARMRRVEFRDCRLSGVVLDGSSLHDVSFRACKLDTASLRSLATERVEFDESVLREADLAGSKLGAARFTSCDLTGARFTQVSAREMRLHGSDVHGIRGADSLRGAVIDEDQVVPFAMALFVDLGVRIDGATRGPDDDTRSS
jgi:uncharacterized protein YjbI with pentapeptide repeats